MPSLIFLFIGTNVNESTQFVECSFTQRSIATFTPICYVCVLWQADGHSVGRPTSKMKSVQRYRDMRSFLVGAVIVQY